MSETTPSIDVKSSTDENSNETIPQSASSTQLNELSDSINQSNESNQQSNKDSQPQSHTNRLNDLSKAQLLTLLSRLQTKLKAEQTEHSKTKQLVELSTKQTNDQSSSNNPLINQSEQKDNNDAIKPANNQLNNDSNILPTLQPHDQPTISSSNQSKDKSTSQSDQQSLTHADSDDAAVLAAQVAALKITSLEKEVDRLNQSIIKLEQTVNQSKLDHEQSIIQIKAEHEQSINKARTVAHKLHEKGKQIQAALTEQQSINQSLNQSMKSFARSFSDMAESIGMKRESQLLMEWLSDQADAQSASQSTNEPLDQSIVDRVSQSINQSIKRMKEESVKSMIELSSLQQVNTQLNQTINQLNQTATQSINQSEHQKLQKELSAIQSASQLNESKVADLTQQLDQAKKSISQLVSITQSNWTIQSIDQPTDHLIDQVNILARYQCKQSNNTWLLCTDQPTEQLNSQSDSQSSANASSTRRFWWTTQSEFVRRKRTQFDSSINQSIKPFVRPTDDHLLYQSGSHTTNPSDDQSVNQLSETKLFDSFIPLVFFDGTELPIELNLSINQSSEQAIEQRWKQLLVKSQQENQSINQSIGILNNQIDSLKLENSRLQQRCSAAQRTISQLMEQQSANDSVGHDDQSISQLEEAISQLRRDLRDSLVDRQALNDRWQQTINRSDETHQRTVDQLNQTVNQLRDQHDQTIKQLKSAITELQSKLDQQKQVTDAQTQTDEISPPVNQPAQQSVDQTANQTMTHSMSVESLHSYHDEMPQQPRFDRADDQQSHQSTNNTYLPRLSVPDSDSPVFSVPTSAFDSSPLSSDQDDTRTHIRSLQSLLRASENRAINAEHESTRLASELAHLQSVKQTINQLNDPASLAYLQHCITQFLATHDATLEPVICQLLNIDKQQVGNLKKEKTQTASSLFSMFKR